MGDARRDFPLPSITDVQKFLRTIPKVIEKYVANRKTIIFQYCLLNGLLIIMGFYWSP